MNDRERQDLLKYGHFLEAAQRHEYANGSRERIEEHVLRERASIIREREIARASRSRLVNWHMAYCAALAYLVIEHNGVFQPAISDSRWFAMMFYAGIVSLWVSMATRFWQHARDTQSLQSQLQAREEALIALEAVEREAMKRKSDNNAIAVAKWLHYNDRIIQSYKNEHKRVKINSVAMSYTYALFGTFAIAFTYLASTYAYA